jgi:hypothetical protein
MLFQTAQNALANRLREERRDRIPDLAELFAAGAGELEAIRK